LHLETKKRIAKLKKAIIISFFLVLTGCSAVEKTYKFSVEFECPYKGKIEYRKILSSEPLRQEFINKLIPALEEGFEYTPGSCIQK